MAGWSNGFYRLERRKLTEDTELEEKMMDIKKLRQCLFLTKTDSFPVRDG